MPLRKPIGALAVDIDPRELFTVVIIDSNLPVPVFAPPVFFEPAVFAGSRRGFIGFFGHRVPVDDCQPVSAPARSRKALT